MSNAAYELELKASGTLSASNNTTTIDAFNNELQAQTKAMPFAMILGKTIAETELERAEWDLKDDEVPDAIRDLEWLQRSSQEHLDLEAEKEFAKKKALSRAWLVSICFSLVTAFGALATINGLPEDLRSLGIQPVFAKSTVKSTTVNAQGIKPPTHVVVSEKHQGRLQPSEPFSTTVPTRVVEEAPPAKDPDGNKSGTKQFKVSSRF
ncbi:MAG: hypothetical protein ACRBCJ_06490 [Hyphomicrobiaceae bacterium]